jgi:hypothetical protein
MSAITGQGTSSDGILQQYHLKISIKVKAVLSTQKQTSGCRVSQTAMSIALVSHIIELSTEPAKDRDHQDFPSSSK